MRPIDADALLAKWNEKAMKMVRSKDGAIPIDFSNVISALILEPTLDDLRPKGRWEPLPEDDREQMVGDQCSLCGYEHFGSRFNFCPNCGAKMENGE